MSKKQTVKIITPVVLLLIVVAMLILFGDSMISRRIAQVRDEPNIQWFNTLVRYSTHLGRSEIYLFTSFTMIVLGFLMKSRMTVSKAGFAFVAMLFTFLIVVTLKFIIGRHRPSIDTEYDSLLFWPFHGYMYDWNSIPSGHSATMGAAFMFLSRFKPMLKLPIFLIAIFVCLTRLWGMSHFLSDITVGFSFGIFCTIFIESKFREKEIHWTQLPMNTEKN